MTTSALRQSQQRAIVKAQAAKLVRLVEPITADCYFVPSTSQSGKWHIVSRSSVAGRAIWSCTCRAGRLPACVHRAAAWKHWINEQAAGGSIPPAPAAALPGVARITWNEEPIESDEWLAIYGKRAA